MDFVTTFEAAALLTARGVRGRGGRAVKATTVQRWCQRGLIAGAQLRGPHPRGTWVIPRAALDHFTPPTMGRPRKA